MVACEDAAERLTPWFGALLSGPLPPSPPPSPAHGRGGAHIERGVWRGFFASCFAREEQPRYKTLSMTKVFSPLPQAGEGRGREGTLTSSLEYGEDSASCFAHDEQLQ